MDAQFVLIVLIALFVIGMWLSVQALYQKLNKIERDVERLLSELDARRE